VEGYTVTFDTDGGSEIAEQRHVKSDSVKATEPDPAPTKANYVFKEWQLNGTPYDFNDPVTANIRLTAAWRTEIDLPTPITSLYDGTTKHGVATENVNYEVVEEEGFTNEATEAGTYQAKIHLVLVQRFLSLLKHLTTFAEHLLGIIILQLVFKRIQCLFAECADRLINLGNARQLDIINDLKNLLILGIIIVGYLLLQILVVDLRTLEGYVYVVFIKLFPYIIKEFAPLILQQKLSAARSVLLQSGALIIRNLNKATLKTSAETDLFLYGMIH
jgi:hypothetical protein